MRQSTLKSHLPEELALPSVLISLLGHIVVVFILVLGVTLLGPNLILVAGGENGETGTTIPVSLTGEITGGTGAVRPTLIPAPEVAKPPPRRPETQSPEQRTTQLKQFEKPKKEEKISRISRSAPRPPDPTIPSQGVIPSDPLPGVGGVFSEGGGLGETGLKIGSGQAGAGVASWYIRQLEQRISRNWLKTSMGSLDRQVVAKISFEIKANGEIDSVRLVASSGVGAVDLAAQRAISASQPLPPLPLELRGRTVEFVAYFEYPPERIR
jgi:TonB family protein